jgi:hypothetical protein
MKELPDCLFLIKKNTSNKGLYIQDKKHQVLQIKSVQHKSSLLTLTELSETGSAKSQEDRRITTHSHFLCLLGRCTSDQDQNVAAQTQPEQTVWPGSSTGMPDHSHPENMSNSNSLS